MVTVMVMATMSSICGLLCQCEWSLDTNEWNSGEYNTTFFHRVNTKCRGIQFTEISKEFLLTMVMAMVMVMASCGRSSIGHLFKVRLQRFEILQVFWRELE